MKPTLIFDYDGTIHNTMIIYESAFRQCYAWLVKEGYAPEMEIPTETVAGWLGMNSWEMWDSFLPELPGTIKEAASRRVGDSMVEQIQNHQAKWYAGAEKVLDELKADGYTMVILSNCKIAYRKANWKEFCMERWFSGFYDCESFDFAPKNKIIKKVQKDFAAPFVVIGDRRSDLDCAAACQCPFIGCLYGFGKDNELDGADSFVKSVRDLGITIQKIRL